MKSIHLMKNVGRFPPPNRQVRFTLKLPSPIYPQIVCTIYPNPPEIAKSDLPSNRLWRFTPPQNRQVRFTLKSPSLIYPRTVCMIYPPKCPSPIYPQIIFGDLPPPPPPRSLRFEGKLDLAISGGGVNRTDDLRVNRTC